MQTNKALNIELQAQVALPRRRSIFDVYFRLPRVAIILREHAKQNADFSPPCSSVIYPISQLSRTLQQ